MRNMTRSDWAWIAGITIICVTINPALKAVGLLPADVFKSLGIFFPGLPQIVFGPLIAFLMLLCFAKTGEPLVFPVIGILRALSLAYLFPKNPEHLGTCIAGIPGRRITGAGRTGFCSSGGGISAASLGSNSSSSDQADSFAAPSPLPASSSR